MTVRRFGPIECESDADCPDWATCSTDGVCVDELGDPIEDDQVILEDVPVRYDADHEVARDEEGAVVRRTPAAKAAGDYVGAVEETDEVDLEPISDAGKPYNGLEVRGVEPVHGRRSRPVKTTITLER